MKINSENKEARMLEKTPHLSLEVCKNVIHSVGEFPLQKTIIATFLCTYSHVMGDGKIFIPVFLLVFMDAVVGVMKALKNKTFSWSQGFKRSGQKFTVYVIMLLASGILDVEFPGNYATTTMKTFLMVTEAISILENIGDMGWPVPIKLLDFLKLHREASKEVQKEEKKKKE